MQMDTHDTVPVIKAELKEREKELDALYRLSSLLTRRIEDTEELFRDTADILTAALRTPEVAGITITAGSHRVSTGTEGPVRDTVRREHWYSMEKLLVLEVWYSDSGTEEHIGFDTREKYLIGSTAMLLADVLERRDMDQMMRETAKVLQQQTSELGNKNIALREVLSQIEQEKIEIKREIRQYISSFILPLVNQLLQSSALEATDRSRLLQLEQLIQQIAGTSPTGYGTLSGALSPRELEISVLIRNGLSTKEIASLLHISDPTVERHRNTIREKLGLTGKQVNLTTFLRSVL